MILVFEIYKLGSVYCLVKGVNKEVCYWVLLLKDLKLDFKDMFLVIKLSSVVELFIW